MKHISLFIASMVIVMAVVALIWLFRGDSETAMHFAVVGFFLKSFTDRER